MKKCFEWSIKNFLDKLATLNINKHFLYTFLMDFSSNVYRPIRCTWVILSFGTCLSSSKKNSTFRHSSPKVGKYLYMSFPHLIISKTLDRKINIIQLIIPNQITSSRKWNGKMHTIRNEKYLQTSNYTRERKMWTDEYTKLLRMYKVKKFSPS